MKLAYQQLQTHLSKTVAPIYWISSDEILLLQEALDLIRHAAQQKGYLERVIISGESSAEWGELLYSGSHSLSLFEEKRLIELDLRDAKLNQANGEHLQEYVEQPSADTLLLIYSHKLEQKQEQTPWYKAIEKKGIVMPIWPITTDQLPQWILQRAKQFQVKLTQTSAAWLATQVEGNLLAAAQEIEKLALLPPDTLWDENKLAEIIFNNSHFDVFSLGDSLLSGNSKRTLSILKNLSAEDAEPTLVLWSITRELRTAAEIQRNLQQGKALPALFAQFKVWEKRQPGMRAFLKRHSDKSCWDLLLFAASVDRVIKGAEPGRVWDMLEKLVLRTTQSGII